MTKNAKTKQRTKTLTPLMKITQLHYSVKLRQIINGNQAETLLGTGYGI